MASKQSALEIVLNLALARTVVVRDMERRLASHGIGLSDLALLLELRSAQSQTLQRVVLADRLGVTPSGVARQVMPLERIGLVARVTDENDARKALVALTEAGERTVSEVLEDAEDQSQTVLSKRWSASELATLADLLARAKD